MDGGRIDASHPAAVSWQPRKGGKRKPARAPTGTTKAPASSPPAPTSVRPGAAKGAKVAPSSRPPRLDEAGFCDEFAELTLREIVDRHGSVPAYADIREANGKNERARALWLKNEQTESRLISRELVRQHIFGAFEAAFKRLTGDTAKTATRRIYAMAKGGSSLEESERVMVDLISGQLKRVKETASRVLRDDDASDSDAHGAD